MSSGISTPFGGEYDSTLGSSDEIAEHVESPDVVAAPQSVIEEWGIPAGHVMVVRDGIETGGKYGDQVILSKVAGPDGQEVAILGDDGRGELMQRFEPWATVLMVGEPYITDYGHTIQPPPIRPGTRVLMVATAAEDIDLEAGGETMRVTLIPFRAIKLWKKDAEK